MNADKLIQELCAPYNNVSLVNFMHDITFPNSQEGLRLCLSNFVLEGE